MKEVTITLLVEVPDEATEKDISDWVDVQYGERNGMKSDNPCINGYEAIDVSFKMGDHM